MCPDETGHMLRLLSAGAVDDDGLTLREPAATQQADERLQGD